MADAVDVMTPDQIAKLEQQIALQGVYEHSRDYDHFFDLDHDFHEIFYMADHKQFIWAWVQQMNLQFNRYRYLRLEVSGLKWHNIITEHQAIVDAVKAKDAELASHLVADHLLAIDDDVKAVLSAYPNYFEGKAAPSHQPD